MTVKESPMNGWKWTSGGLRPLFFLGCVVKSSHPRLGHEPPLLWRGHRNKNDTVNCEVQSKPFQRRCECSSRTNTALTHTPGFPVSEPLKCGWGPTNQSESKKKRRRRAGAEVTEWFICSYTWTLRRTRTTNTEHRQPRKSAAQVIHRTNRPECSFRSLMKLFARPRGRCQNGTALSETYTALDREG